MKTSLLLSLLLFVAAALVTGCSQKENKAQALLIEAISYSEGTPPAAAQATALKLAGAKGFKPSDRADGISEHELVMIAGRELCKQILTDYPDSQAAVKAAELRNQINQKLQVLDNERIRSMFRDSN